MLNPTRLSLFTLALSLAACGPATSDTDADDTSSGTDTTTSGVDGATSSGDEGSTSSGEGSTTEDPTTSTSSGSTSEVESTSTSATTGESTSEDPTTGGFVCPYALPCSGDDECAEGLTCAAREGGEPVCVAPCTNEEPALNCLSAGSMCATFVRLQCLPIVAAGDFCFPD